MSKNLPACLACIATALLCACASPLPQRPELALPASFREGGINWQRIDSPAHADDPAWWHAFGDDELKHLMDQMLEANQTLAQSMASFRQAQAGLASARAQWWPSVTTAGTASRGSDDLQRQLRQALGQSDQGGGVAENVQLTLSASWEPDLWGRISHTVSAQQADVRASAADLAAQRLSMIGQLSKDYFSLRQSDVDIDLLQQQAEVHRRLLHIIEQTRTLGAASADDVLAAQNDLDAAEIVLHQARASRAQMEHAIAVLCGQAPASFAIRARARYAFRPLAVPPSIPSMLLRRRPDIMAAEQRMLAANASIGVARAAFFPTLSLGLSSGYSHDSFGGLFAAPNRIWSLGPQLAQTLFDGGARDAERARAQASYDASVAQYRQTVLAAFQDVEDALSDLHQRTDEVLRQNVSAQRQASAGLGAASQQDVLESTLDTLQSRRSANDAAAELVQASIRLRIAVASDVSP